MHACGHDGHTAMLLFYRNYFAETRNFVGQLSSCSNLPRRKEVAAKRWLMMV